MLITVRAYRVNLSTFYCEIIQPSWHPKPHAPKVSSSSGDDLATQSDNLSDDKPVRER